MRNDQQLVMDRQTRPAADKSVGVGIKTILFHVIDDEFHSERIETALALARSCSAHLSCLHVTPIEAYVAFDSFGGVFVMNDIIRALDERDVELQTKVEERLAKEDVSWDYEQVTGNVASRVISQAALADLLITARNPLTQDFVGPTAGFLGDLLQRSRTPLFIPGSDRGAFDPTGKALIAWNGSFEAANTVRASLGLLRLASEVRVLQVLEKKPDAKQFPATKLLEYLSRQGVHAELATEPSPTGDLGHDVIAGMIIAQARGAGAAYIVMGGYSHMRIGEYLFGGVTRTLLRECPFSLVIAH
ncbi:universal stress protein [Sphingomonas sp.]|uniref:universal stress protein n=1 Tax=Sphingomonas sp. TaxID=28214 RepID=UPI00286A0C97|nr:universal stress protein [Sphingomonas sp.]